MLGQLARQGIRAVAIYLSDVLLWLSVAGIFEIAFVLFAGVLCILTAGFIFDSMKRSPMVLVLGTLVALTGTFLMFREVRGFFWPATSAAGTSETRITPAPSPGPSVKPPPITSTPPELATPNAATRCAGKTQLVCMASDDCYWSLTSRQCLDKPPPASPGIFSTRAPPPDSLCGMMPSEMTCNLSTACYWSPLTRRCEKLLFGTMDWPARH